MYVGVIEGGHISFKQQILGLENDVVVFERNRELVFVVIAKDTVLGCQQDVLCTDYAVYITQHDKSSFRNYFPDIGDGTIGYYG